MPQINEPQGKVRRRRRLRLSFLQYRIDLDLFIHIFCFFSVLLIGADRWGIELIGVNFRIDQIFLCVFTLLLIMKGSTFVFTRAVPVLAFAFFSLISTLFAVSVSRGVLYYCSILYNVVFLFYAFTSYVRQYGINQFLNIFRATCYLQFALLLVQFLLKVFFSYEFPFLPSYGEYFGIPRFQLWFYEPSYLATYLIFWFALSAYMFVIAKEAGYLADLLLAFAMFVMSTATSGFIGIALVILLIYLIWLKRGITSIKLVVPVLLLIAFFVFRFTFSSLYEVFISRLFDTSLDAASGGRIEGWKETWEVFVRNPIFGVGPGNYGLYLGMDAGHVPSNVSLELLATVGTFGFLSFYAITLWLCIRAIALDQKQRSKQTAVLIALTFALVVFTLILQINQGYLRLYHWMFFGCIDGAIYLAATQKSALQANTMPSHSVTKNP